MRRLLSLLISAFIVISSVQCVSAEEIPAEIPGGEQTEVQEPAETTEVIPEGSDAVIPAEEVPAAPEVTESSDAADDQPAAETETQETAEPENPAAETPAETVTESPSETDTAETSGSDETVPQEVTETKEETAEEPAAEETQPETEDTAEETKEEEKTEEPEKEIDPVISVSAHVENIGWMSSVSGKNVSVGTTGRSLRMEAIRFTLSEEMKELGGIEITAHVQDIGWMRTVSDDQTAGTTGRSLRMEAIRLSFTGELAEKFDLSYRVHVQDIGWTRWVKNGALAGTTGQSRRLEAIDIAIQPKGTSQAGSQDIIVVPPQSGGPVMPLQARAHVQDIGWTGYVDNGGTIGTTGRSLHMEALTVRLSPELLSQGNVSVQAHVANIGWLGGAGSGETAGTTGRNLQLEGVRITLTGALSEKYDIYYRAHVAGVGWLAWTWNGELAGSEGCSRAIEALQIEIAEKGSAAHATGQGYIAYHKTQYDPVYYSQADPAWAGKVYGRWAFAGTGCVPTAIAMTLSAMVSVSLIPTVIGDYLHSIGTFNNSFAGASSDSIPKAAANWGTKAYGLSSAGDIREALKNGRTVLIAVNPGTFCPPGTTHEILLFNLNLNDTYVYDPLVSSRNGWYNVDMIWDQRSSAAVDWVGGYVAYALYK